MTSGPTPATQDAPRLLVSLATYNESGNLAALVEEILRYAPHASILVIDDASPDGTGAIADRLRAEGKVFDVLHRPGKLGLGTAVLAGMQYAIDNNFDYILNLDADYSHPPRFIPAILAGMADHDVMIGSRYIPGGGVEGEFNLKRKFMSTGINMVRPALPRAEDEATTAARSAATASRSWRRSTCPDKIRSRGYSFMEEILYWCRTVGCRFGETPILFENRRSGVSKINKGEAIKALQIILQLGIGRALGQGRPGAPGVRGL